MPYVLLSPAVLVTLLIVFLPMVQAVVHEPVRATSCSSRRRRISSACRTTSTLLHDPVFWSSLRHTALWIGLTVPLQMLLGLVTALLLNQEFPWRGLARALVIIPWALPSVVIALMWRWIYDPQHRRAERPAAAPAS